MLAACHLYFLLKVLVARKTNLIGNLISAAGRKNKRGARNARKDHSMFV